MFKLTDFGLTGPLSPLFIRLRAGLRYVLKKDDLFRQLQRTALRYKNIRDKNREEKRTALFFAPRWWTTHQIWEASIAEAMSHRGIEPVFVTCGKAMNFCESYLMGVYPPDSLCNKCRTEMKWFLDQWGFQSFEYASLVSTEEIASIQKNVQNLKLHELPTFRFADICPWSVASASIQRYFLSGDIPLDASNEAVLKRFVFSTIVAYRGAEEAVKKLKPEFAFLLNGLFFPERALRMVLDREKIPYTTYERGRRRDTLIFSKGEAVIDHNLETAWKGLAATPLATEEESRLDQYLEVRETGKDFIDNFWPEVVKEEKALVDALALDLTKPVFSLFTNLTWDTAVFGKNKAFASMKDWIAHAIQVFCTRPDLQLVIRVHPAEVRIEKQATRERIADFIRETFPNLPSNVKIVNSDSALSSYTLANLSKAILVYTTTLGMELPARTGIASIVSGIVHYSRKGFTFDVETAGDLEKHVAAIASEKTNSPERKARQSLARRYLNLFYFKYHYDFSPVLIETGKNRFKLALSDTRALEPGHAEDLDEVVLSSLTPAIKGSLAHSRPR